MDLDELTHAGPGPELLSTIVCLTQSAVTITDADGLVLWVNDGFSRLSGYGLDDLRGRKPGDVLQGPGTDPDTILFMRERLGARQGFIVELLNYHRDGRPYTVQTEVQPLRDDNGRVSGFMSMSHDVTALRRHAEELDRARTEAETLARAVIGDRERLELALRAGDMAPFRFRRDDDTIELSLDWRQRLGLGADDAGLVRGWEQFLALLHPDDRRMLEQLDRAGWPEETITSGADLRVRFVDGSWRWVRATMMVLERDVAGDALCMIGVFQDITRRRSLEERVRSQRALLSTIIDSIPHAIFWKGCDGLLLGCNRTFADFAGLADTADVLGRPASEFFPLRADEIVAEDRDVTERREPIQVQTRLVDASGRSAPVLLSKVPWADADGQVIGLIGGFADLTRIEDLEAELDQARRLEAVGQLAAGIAHEINTPMQYIGDNVGFLGKALDRLLDLVDCSDVAPEDAQTARLDFLRERAPRAVQQASEGVAAVSRIVQAMKVFSHGGSEDFVATDLAACIHSTLTVCRNEYKYVADVALELHDDLPLVPAVAGELNQVLLNIVVNAAHAIGERFGPNGPRGTITVSARPSDDRSSVRIEVTDDGVGIPAEIIERVFDQFFTTKEVGRGTGQGLALSRRIVTRHQGALRVRSVVGEGSTFIVVLPVVRRDETS